MASRRRSRSRPRAMSSGGGAGFMFPPFSLQFTGSGFPGESDAATVAGALTVSPADSSLTLLDSDGNKYALDGLNVIAGATPVQQTDAPSQPITVRQLWGGRTVDTVLSIPVSEQSIALAGAHTFAHAATTGTVVGALSSVPGGTTFSIVTQDAANGVQISGSSLQKGSGTVTAGAYNVTVRATKNGRHWDQVFALTAS